MTTDTKAVCDKEVTMATEDEPMNMTSDDDSDTDNGSHDDDVEMKELISEMKPNKTHSKVRRILTRLPWLLLAIMVLVVGIVLSQYHVHPSYEPSCNDTQLADNFTMTVDNVTIAMDNVTM